MRFPRKVNRQEFGENILKLLTKGNQMVPHLYFVLCFRKMKLQRCKAVGLLRPAGADSRGCRSTAGEEVGRMDSWSSAQKSGNQVMENCLGNSHQGSQRLPRELKGQSRDHT